VQVFGPSHHVYVSNNVSAGTVTEIDGVTNSVGATLTAGAFPSGVDVDTSTGRVDVASNSGNSVSIFHD
jgi:DNA-binding beta-propeller fold protein YncE